MSATIAVPVVETDVLIVGSGPAGASLASFLGYHGVSGLMISRDKHTAPQPRAHMTNPAAWECLRDIGLEEEYRQVAMGKEFYGVYRVCHTLGGQDIIRLHSFGCKPDRLGDYDNASPCERADVSQNVGEPILHKFATLHGFQTRMNCKFLSYETDEITGLVTSTIQDQVTNTTFKVTSKYLCGADGAGSYVAKQAGLPFNTLNGGGVALNAWYEADLTKIYQNQPSMLSVVLNPDVDAPLWSVSALNRTVRPYKEFVMSMRAHPTVTSIDVSEEEVVKRLHQLIGDDTIPIKIKGIYRWRVNESYAETTRKGNVFCLGDAIHRHSPGKGLGSNTGIQDAYNLAWKLAYVLQGKADAKLLDSYDLERQPIAKRVVRNANDSLRLIDGLARAMGVVDPTVEGRMAALKELEEATPQGKARRDALKKAREALYDETSGLGAEMNQAYNSGAVYLDDEVDPNPTWPEGSEGVQHHSISTYPGSRLPHAWLGTSRFGEQVSTHDIAGKGKFTLFTGIGGAEPWQAAAEGAMKALAGKVEIVVRSIGPGQEFADRYYMWEERRGVQENGAVLVRPDRTVAWRCADPSKIDYEEKLTHVMRHVLGHA